MICLKHLRPKSFVSFVTVYNFGILFVLLILQNFLFCCCADLDVPMHRIGMEVCETSDRSTILEYIHTGLSYILKPNKLVR